MSKHENLRATGEALSSIGRSAKPISRHDAALQRYLRAMDHTGPSHVRDTETPASPAAAKVPHPLFTEIHAVTPSPLEGAPAAGEERDSGLGRADIVVVGIDGSAHARKAAHWAAVEADRRHAQLRLVHAYTLPIAGYAGYSMAPNDLGAIMRVEGTAMLRDVAAELRAEHPSLDVAIRLFQGDAVQALRRESERARLTVVGSRGNGRVSGVLLGSVAMAITSHGTAPVAVIPAEGPGGAPDGPVVVGVDGSATSEAAIAFAFDDAAVRGVRLLAVHTWNDVRPTLADPTMIDYAKLEDGERAGLSEQLAGWRDKYPDVDVRPIVVRGRPTQTLLHYAGQAQLVVVGSRGRGGFAGMLLGSTSHSLISHAICPVVVVRPDSLR
jgi:nucleotide-binding universal stress UspA family protein